MPEFIFNKPSFKNASLSLLLGLSLAACTNGPGVHKPRVSAGVLKSQTAGDKARSADSSKEYVVAANPDQISRVSNLELSEDPDLPLQDLDADTLENLLVMNFASFQRNWSLATTSSVAAAGSSQDFRVARSATLFALEDSDYKAADEASSIWLSLKPDSVDAQNMAILALVGSQQIDAAIVAINHQIGDQNIDDYIKQLAGLLIRQSNAYAGFEIADYMVQEYPESAQVLVSAAYVAQNFKKYEAAEVWTDRALEVRPGWDLAAQLYANLLSEQDKAGQRAAFIDQFVRDFPDSVAMRISHAAELGRAKKYQEAYDLVLAVLKGAPNEMSALQYAAGLAEQLQNNKKSALHLRRALRIEPQNDDVRWSLARLSVIDKKYVTAERLFDEIQDKSLYIRAQIQVANLRLETQGVKAAINTLRALQPRTEGDYLQVAITRHYLLMSAYEYDEAFDYVNETLVYLPDNLELLYARALVAAELGKIDITEKDLRKIIAKQPKHANALNALGYTLADQTTRYEEAKALIVKALVLRPNDAHILDSMGWVSYRLNDFETAIEFLQKAYNASPEAEVAAHLGEVLWESGSHDEANALFKKSFAEETDNPILNKAIERYKIQLGDDDDVSTPSESSSE
jgi:tetratricopeptide (TPR) repeat protein